MTHRLDRAALLRGELLAVPADGHWKDYDARVEERPQNLAATMDTTSWKFFEALEDNALVGSAIVICKPTGEFDELLARMGDATGAAILLDVRVAAEVRGLGVGAALVRAAAQEAAKEGCSRLIIETQDTNVAACMLYQTAGAKLDHVDFDGYQPDLDEALLLWSLPL